MRGYAGRVGYGVARRGGLLVATLLGAALGVTRRQLQQILGVWGFAAAFRREALSVLDVAFTLARRLPQRTATPLEGAVLDELLVLCCLAPLLEADLRAAPFSLCWRRMRRLLAWELAPHLCQRRLGIICTV